RRQQLLAERLAQTQREFSKNTAELAAMHKRRKQLGRATSRLVTGKSPHELNQMANAGVVKTGEMIRHSPGALLSAAKAFRKP
ncbi:MAG: hypothetical protein VXW43_15650, partial [Pseudomonadota bacterium]|nr:hypothetical protein [Pseudomonadota bacterium]